MMFAAYPGFEFFELRLEVEWEDRPRPIIARMMSVPDSGDAIIICNFADDADAGDWATVINCNLYPLSPPEITGKIAQKVQVFDVATRQARTVFLPRAARLPRLLNLIRKSWFERSVVRLFYLPDLPDAPRLVCEGDAGFAWSLRDGFDNLTPFTPEPAAPALSLSAPKMRQQLQSQWHQHDSDVHFAWKWGRLDHSQSGQWNLLLDSELQSQNIQRVMHLILLSSAYLWRSETPQDWCWHFNVSTGYSVLGSRTRDSPPTRGLAERWGSFLRKHYMARLRHDWVEKHECARYFMSIRNKNRMPIVQEAQTPTAHEQLEARLALRDWLANAATPAVAARLLASLDAV